jgi:hypothetical protein
MTITRNLKMGLAVYAIFLVGYCCASGNRLLHKSTETHFSYQADMFLHRRLDLGHPPPNSNDWAEVEYLHLKDGRTVAGTFIKSNPFHFRELDGKIERLTDADIANRWKKYYVSFPPFPSAIFLPLVAIFGLGVNDVLVTVVLAALAPMLLFFVLRRLAARGDSTRSEEDDLWLTAMFGFGTVFFYTSVIGQVWYTAHVVAMVLTGLFVLAALDARHPILAGLCIGALLLTRPHIAAWSLFFFYEAWRAHGRKVPVGKIVAFGVPLVVLGGLGFVFNWARFGAFGEFGHFYLNVRWTDRIQRYGLTNFSFLSRNLAVALVLTPKFISKAPYIQFGYHGMSLLLTTPGYIFLLWPRVKSSLHTALWAVVAPIALAGFMYQNDGWIQFGYRFSNDFSFALIMLLAIGGRPLTRTWKALILVGVVVNLFGAISFGRMNQFYFDGFFPISLNEL